jgi:hypothetical protein
MDFKKTNSAVLKKMFLHMEKATFIENVRFLKNEYLNLKPDFYNKNYEMKLSNLYKFCMLFYLKKWCKKK